MKFSLACITNLGNVFGGKEIRTPLEGKLAVATDYSLIYVALSGHGESENNFDVINSLNEAFGLGLDFKLLVKSAGFLQLKNLRSDIKVTSESLESNFPIIPFPKSSGHFKQILNGVTCFWAEIEFSSWSIGNSLVEIGSGKTDYLSVYGFFAKSSEVTPKSSYSAELPDFTLFKLFSFKQLSLQYTFENSAAYSIEGRIGIKNFVNQNDEYYFIGKIEKKESNVLGILKSEKPIDLTLPFNMPGIRFSDLKFAVWHPQSNNHHARPESLYWLQGIVKYGTLNLSGQIYLMESSPILVKVELLDSLSIETLFEQSIPGFKWPRELIDITFKKGSVIYYYNKKDNSDGSLKSDFIINGENEIIPVSDSNPYEKGFNIYAKIDLTLLKTISFSGNFRIISEAKPYDQSNGVTASIQLENSIDIYVLQISAATDDGGRGPRFEVSTANNKYIRLKSSLKFFKTNFGADTALEVTKDQDDPNNSTLVRGTLSTQERFALFDNKPISLTFSYSKYRGFKVEGWPEFALIRNIIDFLKELEKLTNTGGICGSVANLVGRAYDTTYKITPSLRSDNDKLYFDLTGEFLLSVIGEQIATVTFPRFPMEIPPHVSINELPDAIATSISHAAGDFLKALRDDPEAFSRFLAIVTMGQAAKITAKLICEGLIDGAVQAAVDAGVSAMAAAGGIAAGVGAIAAASGAIADSFRKHRDSGDRSNAGDDHRDGDGRNTDHNPIAPSTLVLHYENSCILTNWNAVRYAAGYQVTLIDSLGTQLDRQRLPNSQTTKSFPISESMIATSYTVKVAATRGDYSSPEAIAAIDRWQSPTDLQLSLVKDSQKIRAIWTGTGANNQSHYVLQLIRNNTPVTSKEALNSPVEFDATSLLPGEYQATIAVTGDSSKLPSLPSPPSNSVYRLAPPEDVRLTFDPAAKSLNITWKAVESAAQYLVSILDEHGNKGTATISVPATNHDLTVPLDNFTGVPGVYHAQIVAVGNDVSFDSPIARSTDTITKLGELQDVSQSANKAKQQLVVVWHRLEGAIQYEVQLFEQKKSLLLKKLVVNQPASETEPLSTEIDLTPYLEPQGLTLMPKVYSKGTLNLLPGNFLAASTLVRQIAAPTNLAMNWFKESDKIGRLNVTWQGSEQAVHYRVEIREVATQLTILSKTIGSAPLNLTILESEFPSPPNGTYQLEMQALSDENNFDSTIVQGSQVDIINLLPPVLNLLTVANGTQLIASLDRPTHFAEGYQTQLVVDGNPVGEVVEVQPDDRYQAVFPVDETTHGTRFQVRVRATKPDHAPSDWVTSSSITRLATPELQPLVLLRNTIIVSLVGAVEGANSYQAQLISMGKPIGQPISMTTTMTTSPVTQAQFTINRDGIVPPFQARVKASGANHVSSLWITSTPVELDHLVDWAGTYEVYVGEATESFSEEVLPNFDNLRLLTINRDGTVEIGGKPVPAYYGKWSSHDTIEIGGNLIDPSISYKEGNGLLLDLGKIERNTLGDIPNSIYNFHQFDLFQIVLRFKEESGKKGFSGSFVKEEIFAHSKDSTPGARHYNYRSYDGVEIME